MTLPWRFLRPGDPVAVVLPSGPVDFDDLRSGIDVLRNWGLQPLLAPAAESTNSLETGKPVPDYLAASDAMRADHLLWALTDPKVRAVFVARGGYGLLRIIDRIPADVLRSTERFVVGFSDATVLHERLASLGVPSIHAPNVCGLSASGPSAAALHRLLFDGEWADVVSRSTTVRDGSARAVLRGGNLAMLAANAGTPDSCPAEPFIAVLEDVNETPYRVDRMLTQLLRSGWFERAVGVVCGTWAGCGTHEQITSVLVDRLAAVRGPMVIDATFGHDDVNLALPFGVPVRFTTAPLALTAAW
jgi:muramoyltetrapeptide carboxypeptidase